MPLAANISDSHFRPVTQVRCLLPCFPMFTVFLRLVKAVNADCPVVLTAAAFLQRWAAFPLRLHPNRIRSVLLAWSVIVWASISVYVVLLACFWLPSVRADRLTWTTSLNSAPWQKVTSFVLLLPSARLISLCAETHATLTALMSAAASHISRYHDLGLVDHIFAYRDLMDPNHHIACGQCPKTETHAHTHGERCACMCVRVRMSVFLPCRGYVCTCASLCLCKCMHEHSPNLCHRRVLRSSGPPPSPDRGLAHIHLNK